jgi:hypothetical protein
MPSQRSRRRHGSVTCEVQRYVRRADRSLQFTFRTAGLYLPSVNNHFGFPTGTPRMRARPRWYPTCCACSMVGGCCCRPPPPPPPPPPRVQGPIATDEIRSAMPRSAIAASRRDAAVGRRRWTQRRSMRSGDRDRSVGEPKIEGQKSFTHTHTHAHTHTCTSVRTCMNIFRILQPIILDSDSQSTVYLDPCTQACTVSTHSL